MAISHIVGEDIDLSDGASLEVYFEAGQIDRNISLPFIDDIFPEHAETFDILLTTSAGVFLFPYTRTVVTITDDDPDLADLEGQWSDMNLLSHVCHTTLLSQYYITVYNIANTYICSSITHANAYKRQFPTYVHLILDNKVAMKPVSFKLMHYSDVL